MNLKPFQLKRAENWTKDQIMGGSGNRRRKAPTLRNSQLTNIVKTAVRIIAGSHTREVSRAAEVIGVSEPTLYRWLRAGSMREARGAEVLRVHELTGLPLEMLLRG
jgi:hypothetical protein